MSLSAARFSVQTLVVMNTSLRGTPLSATAFPTSLSLPYMLRHHAASGSDVAVRCLYSARTLGDVIYRDELMGLTGADGIDIRLTLTREQPEGWEGYAGRIDRAMTKDLLPLAVTLIEEAMRRIL